MKQIGKVEGRGVAEETRSEGKEEDIVQNIIKSDGNGRIGEGTRSEENCV